MKDRPIPDRPSPLLPGATLAVISPASAVKPERVHLGIERLQAMGYRTVLSKHALGSGPLYYAAPVDRRVEDLHAAFADPAVDGVICTRGGWGSAELLPYLDAALIRSNRKAFIGYSDHTSLHTWFLEEAGMISFYGPMVAPDFARHDGVEAASWAASVERRTGWSLGPVEGLRVLRPGLAGGMLRGGCISILAESLGTPFGPKLRGGVLFLEDVGTKPYQWDRMLLHLRYAGQMDEVQGIVFGDMAQCVPVAEAVLLEAAILHALRDFPGPIAIGLQCGHVDAPNVTLPLGVHVRLDLRDDANPRMHFADPASASSL